MGNDTPKADLIDNFTKPRLVALLIARATLLAYPELLPELLRCLSTRSIQVVLFTLDHEGDTARVMPELEGLDLQGLIAAVRPSEDELRWMQRRGLAVMLYNCHAAQPTADSVSCDHAACGRVLAELLLDGGHRRFGIIGSPPDSLVGVERVAGAVDALKRRRALALEIEAGDYSYESGALALDALFSRMKPKPSAIIAANDAMAIGALDRARELQTRIPRDLSIVGIDGTGTARLPSYDLTTLRQPLARMAAAACELLDERMQHPERPVEVRLFGGELIRGRTARFEPRRIAIAR